MKAKEAMETLRITRPTLCKYVKKGWITVKKLPGGQYEYDESSVYNFTKEDKRTKTKAEVLTDCIKYSTNVLLYLKASHQLPQECTENLDKLVASYKELKKLK